MKARCDFDADETMMLWPSHCSAGTGRAEDDFQPYMQVYLHPDRRRRPVLVIYPGGGYCIRAPHEGIDVAEKFRSLGFHCVVVQYRVSPYRFPAEQQDALRAIRLVRANAARWNMIPDQISVCGFSAGGHLAGSTGVMYDKVNCDAGDEADQYSCRPDALVLGYPVITFDAETGHCGSGLHLLGEDQVAARAAEVELDKLVTPDTPPAFVWHTAEDQAVPVRGSLRFVTALQKNGIRWGLHVFPCGRHGLGLAEPYHDLSKWPELVRDFLAEGIGLIFPGKEA